MAVVGQLSSVSSSPVHLPIDRPSLSHPRPPFFCVCVCVYREEGAYHVSADALPPAECTAAGGERAPELCQPDLLQRCPLPEPMEVRRLGRSGPPYRGPSLPEA